jgi:hypothetical protein
VLQGPRLELETKAAVRSVAKAASNGSFCGGITITLPKAAPDRHSIIQLVPSAENDIVAGAAAAWKDVSGKLLRQAEWGGAPWQPVSSPARSLSHLAKRAAGVSIRQLFSRSAGSFQMVIELNLIQ